jgi:DNA-binding PadR family transcriptional regulator
MTTQVLRVLAVLLEEPTADHYGMELMRSTGLKSGTLYPILARLERAGWLTSDWENVDAAVEGRPRRRMYTLAHDAMSPAQEALRNASRGRAGRLSLAYGGDVR